MKTMRIIDATRMVSNAFGDVQLFSNRETHRGPCQLQERKQLAVNLLSMF
jgi:hypothetical protein